MDCESLDPSMDSTIYTPTVRELCRLCANTDNQLINIFNEEGLEHNIYKKIEKHIPIIKVTESDKLPLQICYQCASTLIAWHNLYEGCEAADKRLREILNIEDEQILDSDEDNRIDFADTSADDVLNEKFASKTNDGEKGRQYDASTSNIPSNTVLRLQDYIITPRFAADDSSGFCQSKTGDNFVASAKSDHLICNFCPKVFVTKSAIELHLSKSHSEAYDSTNRLGFKRKLIVRTDQTSSTSSNDIRCKICSKLCLTERGLKRHHNAKHAMTLVCDYCSEKFSSIDAKRTHINEYHKHSSTVSTENGTDMDSKYKEKEDDGDSAETEMNSSDVEKNKPQNLVCKTCGNNYPTAESLRRHLGNGHRRQEKSIDDPFKKWYVYVDCQKLLKCDKCKYNSSFHHKGRFLEHYRIHTGERPYTCGECSKTFRTKTLLQKHIMHVHQGVKEHACDICGRKFSDKRYMADHRRIHTGEKPFVCDLCGKTFRQSASLFIHKELHKGLRKHACHLCIKRFTTRSSLTMHLKRHANERNYICAECGKAFVDGKHLRDHMVVHSNERPFECNICSHRFKLLKHLKQHGRTHKRAVFI